MASRYCQRLARIALVSTALAGFQALPANAQQVGTGAAVRGSVFVDRGQRAAVSTGTDFFLQDRVETLAASRLQILLLDQTTFTVGQNATVTIDRFVYDPDRNAADVSANIAKGAFRFVGGRRGGAVATIDTPAATIGIRGTFLEGVVGPQASQLAELAGIPALDCGDPDDAVFVALRGAGRNETSGGHFNGRIVVDSGADRVTLSESNWAVFVPGRDCPISQPAFYEGAVRQALDGDLRTSPSISGQASQPAALDPLRPGVLPPAPPLPEVLAPMLENVPGVGAPAPGGGTTPVDPYVST